MRETFRDSVGLNRANMARLETINTIIEEYRAAGYTLTLRQLYYQLVSRDIIPNLQAEYKKLGTLLVKGRMAGIVDWEAIEDRIRVPFLPYWVLGVSDAIEDTINQYRLDRMSDQDVYIELWVEKDALSGVLKRITSKYHINLMVNRGYSSCSAMHDAFKRLERQVAKRHGLNRCPNPQLLGIVKKLFAEVTISEVFKILVQQFEENGKKYLLLKPFEMNRRPFRLWEDGTVWASKWGHEFICREGFSNRVDLYKFLSTHYRLEREYLFGVYRWKDLIGL